MVELPKTDAELKAYVDEAVKQAKASFQSEYDEKFYKARKEYESKLDDLKKQQELGKEEYAKQKLAEQQKLDQAELEDLRKFKKSAELGERLAKEGLPSYFKNDVRLLNATNDDIDSVVKSVKSEYEATLPKGNQYSSVVQTNTGNTPVANDKDGLVAMGKALEKALRK